jgi:hypothetical protein
MQTYTNETARSAHEHRGARAIAHCDRHRVRLSGSQGAAARQSVARGLYPPPRQHARPHAHAAPLPAGRHAPPRPLARTRARACGRGRTRMILSSCPTGARTSPPLLRFPRAKEESRARAPAPCARAPLRPALTRRARRRRGFAPDGPARKIFATQPPPTLPHTTPPSTLHSPTLYLTR